MPVTRLEVAFVCRRCNALSPMAARLARQAGGEAVHAWSAGTEPGGRILPGTLTALREVGIDTSDLIPVPARRGRLEEADIVVAIGLTPDDEPLLEGLDARVWALASPQGGQLIDFRETRDELGMRVRGLLREEGIELDETASPFDGD